MKKIVFLVSLFICCSLTFAQVKTADANNTDALLVASDVQTAMSNPDFKVTAGDVYTLAYAAGSTSVKYPILVDSTYKIRVSNLAVIDASGKTFLELKKQVEDIVSKNYPLSGVQFVLTTPSYFTVVVKGEVKQTEEKKVWALTRLSDLITNNLTAHSSIRNIMVTSSSGKIKTYDLFKATRDGDMNENPYLRPGDVISIKKADRIVSLSGSIQRGGSYQIKTGENLKELLNYYGNGLELYADVSRVEITRYGNQDYRVGQKLYVDYDANQTFELLDGDAVYIPSYKELKPVLFLEGAIGSEEGVELSASTKKRIQFDYGTKYTFLLRRYASWFTAESDIKNSYIIRNDQIIPLDVNKILYDSTYETDLLIEPYDTLRIPFKQYFVSVAGSVVAPDRYPYIPDRTWDYYIGLAGGFLKTENKNDTVKIVDINGNELSKTDIITPECTITAATNSGLYYFNMYAPVVTTVLSLISTTLSVLAVTGVFK